MLAATLRRFVVLPKWAPETLALWIIHTYAFQLRDVSTYLGIQSPEKRCGKTTLLSVLSELANRSVTAANISSPAFFRVIEELQPTLFIDETDTFLQGNEQLKGILNSGYYRKTSYVLRVVSQGPTSQSANESPATLETSGRVIRFSCWCPKVMASIGPLPDTLADRCIIIKRSRQRHLGTATGPGRSRRRGMAEPRPAGSHRPDRRRAGEQPHRLIAPRYFLSFRHSQFRPAL
jgi:putative DNA primase/helicase